MWHHISPWSGWRQTASSTLGFLALSNSWISYALHRWWQLTLTPIMSYSQFFLITHVKKERLNESKFSKSQLQHKAKRLSTYLVTRSVWFQPPITNNPIHDQFICQPIQLSWPNNSPFSPIHIHDQFIFLTDSCFKNYSLSKNAWILGSSIPSYWTSVLPLLEMEKYNLAVGHIYWTAF